MCIAFSKKRNYFDREIEEEELNEIAGLARPRSILVVMRLKDAARFRHQKAGAFTGKGGR